MLRPVIVLSAIIVAASSAGCKVRSGLASVKDAAATPAETVFQPNDHVQASARKRAEGKCAQIPSDGGAWGSNGDADQVATASFAPGLTSINSALPPPLDPAFWNVTAGDNLTIVALKGSERNPPALLARFASKDAHGVNWVMGDRFAKALEAVYAEGAPNGFIRMGLVFARRIIRSDKAPDGKGVPELAATPEIYNNCGDALVSRQVIARDLPLIILAKSADFVDIKAILVRALGPGYSDEDLKTLKAEIAAGKVMIRAVYQDGDKPLQTSDAVINLIEFFRTTVGEGVSSSLYVAEPYAAFQALDEQSDKPGAGGPQDLNAALAAAAALRAVVASGAADQSAVGDKIDDIEGQITACGGLRFNEACKTLAPKAAAIAEILPNFASPPLSAERAATVWVNQKSPASSPRNRWVCVQGVKTEGTPNSRTLSRAEVQQLWKTPAFRKKIFDAKFSSANNFFNGSPDERLVKGEVPSRSRGPSFDIKYEYFWLRPVANPGNTRTVARVEDKKNPNSRFRNGQTGTWSDDYPLELSFVEVPEDPANYASGLCVLDPTSERGNDTLEEEPEP